MVKVLDWGIFNGIGAGDGIVVGMIVGSVDAIVSAKDWGVFKDGLSVVCVLVKLTVKYPTAPRINRMIIIILSIDWF